MGVETNGGTVADGGSAETISVFLVDDAPELRELMRCGIEQDPGFDVVGEAGDGRGAIEGIGETAPAAVLLDLSMPGMDGFQAILEIRSRRPQIAIVVISGFSADRMSGPVLERGADRYVEKGASIERLREIIRGAVAERQGLRAA